MTYDAGNPGPRLGQAQMCGRVNVIPIYPFEFSYLRLSEVNDILY